MTSFALNAPVSVLRTGWETVRLGDIVSLLNRGTAPVYADEPTGLLVYNQKCTRPNRTVDMELARPHIQVEDLTNHRARLVAGDVLVNSTGKGTLGRVARFPGAPQPVLADGHVSILRSRTEVVDSRFLSYALGTEQFYDFANAALAVGATSQTELNRDTLAATRLALPSLDTQEVIVAHLDGETRVLTDLTHEQERLRTLALERYRCLLVETMLSAPFPQRPLKTLLDDRFTGVWGGEPAGDGTDFVCARVADFNRDDFTVGPDVPTLRAIPANDQVRRELLHGDILLERSGGTQAKPVGCTVTWMGEGKAVCSNFVEVCRPSAEHNPRYVALLMAALYQSGQTAQHVKQTIGIQNLDARRYFATWVPVPDRTQQDEVVVAMERAAEDARALRAELDRQLALIAERREALILAAVTGQIDIDGKAA